MARPWGAGTAAIARALLGASRSLLQIDLAKAARVTQPRVSQVLNAFENRALVQRSPQGWISDQSLLLKEYLAQYRARQTEPETYWYGLDPIRVQIRLMMAATEEPLVISADLAPDLIVPWRNPTTTIVWTTRAPLSMPLVPAESRASASLILRVTDDVRMLADTQVVDGLVLTNFVQQAIDLIDLGGADRIEAAERLIQRTVGVNV